MNDNTDDTVELPLGAVQTDSPTTPLGSATDGSAAVGSAMAGPATVGFAEPAAPAAFDQLAAPAASGPRIRWAGVIWGLAFAVVGFVALRMLLNSAGRDAVYAWTTELTPLSIVSTVVLVIGALLLLTGLVGLAHRLQRGRRQPR